MMTPLPETGYLRLPQIIGDPKANPPIPALIPVSRTTWWAGVSSGFFPKPTFVTHPFSQKQKGLKAEAQKLARDWMKEHG
jgi:hypothetical protein